MFISSYVDPEIVHWYIIRKIKGYSCYKTITPVLSEAQVFFKTIWLPHNGQLWAIIEGTASPNVIHCVLHFRSEGHWKPHSEVGSLSTAERLVGIEQGTFQFLLQHLNPLGHSPNSWINYLLFKIFKFQHFWLSHDLPNLWRHDEY